MLPSELLILVPSLYACLYFDGLPTHHHWCNQIKKQQTVFAAWGLMVLLTDVNNLFHGNIPTLDVTSGYTPISSYLMLYSYPSLMSVVPRFARRLVRWTLHNTSPCQNHIPSLTFWQLSACYQILEGVCHITIENGNWQYLKSGSYLALSSGTVSNDTRCDEGYCGRKILKGRER